MEAEFNLKIDVIGMMVSNYEYWQRFTRFCVIVIKARQAKKGVKQKE
jgi:hypothetical protein